MFNRYIDEDQLVINLKKRDSDLKWPDIVESWESLTAGSTQLLKGTSIYLIGDSTDINQKVAHELAVGLGYGVFYFLGHSHFTMVKVHIGYVVNFLFI